MLKGVTGLLVLPGCRKRGKMAKMALLMSLEGIPPLNTTSSYNFPYRTTPSPTSAWVHSSGLSQLCSWFKPCRNVSRLLSIKKKKRPQDKLSQRRGEAASLGTAQPSPTPLRFYMVFNLTLKQCPLPSLCRQKNISRRFAGLREWAAVVVWKY